MPIKKYHTKEERTAAKIEQYKKWRTKPENNAKHRIWSRVATWRDQGFTLTWEGFMAMLNAQDFRCKICGCAIEAEGHSSIPDHNHATGKVRGILCKKCNTLLGMCSDSKSILEKALAYLESDGL